MSNDGGWLTTGQVAAITGYSTVWVREQIRQGRLPARQHLGRTRRSLRIHRDDLERFIDHWLSPTDGDVTRGA